MGPQVERDIQERCQRFDIMALLETHVGKDELLDAASKMASMGLRSAWAEAQYSGRGHGTNGGSVVVARKHIGMYDLTCFSPQRDVIPLVSPITDCTATWINTGKVSFMFIAVYFKPSIGLTGENLTRMKALSTAVGLLDCEWIMIGDFNVPSEVMKAHWWPEKINGVVITPSDAVITCTTGQLGSLIDFAIVSRGFEGWIREFCAEQVPWKPHIGLRLVLSQPCEDQWIKEMRKPWMPQLAPVKKSDRHMGGEEDTGALSWALCSGACGKGANREKTHQNMRSIPALLGGQETMVLGRRYAELVSAIEMWMAVKTASVSEYRKRFKREDGPHFVHKKILVRDTSAKYLPHLVHAPLLRWWSIMAAQWALLSKLRRRSDTNEQIGVTCAYMRKEMDAYPGHPEKMMEQLPSMEEWNDWVNRAETMSAAEILNVLDAVAEAQKRARNTHCKTGASEFTKWVAESLATPCKSGAVYKWTKGRCKQPPSTVESPLYKGPVQCPKKVMAHRRMQWQDVWGDQPSRLLPTVELMKELRDEAIQERLDLIDLACFDEAVFSFNDATALGLDCIAPRVLKSLPHKARLDIVGLLNECEAKQAWPWQMLGQLLVLIGKETGGERPIALICMLLRVWTRCRRSRVAVWTDAHKGHWDYAVKNSSSLRSAILQRLRIEIDSADRKEWMTILWDYSRFYDTVELAAMARQAKRRRFPVAVLHMQMLIYMGPRILKQERCFSDWTQPVNGVLPGDGMAGDMARCAVYDMAEEIVMAFPHVTLSQFVDDFKQYASGESEQIIAAKVLPAARAFVQKSKDASLKLSGKSVIVASSRKAAEHVASEIGKMGVEVGVVESARDLGIDINAKGRRILPTRARRLEKAQKRNKKVIKINLKWARAKINQTATLPTETYGQLADGVPRSQRLKLRRRLAAACGWKPGMCSTTLLELEALGANPMVHIPCKILADYLQMWLIEKECREGIERVWAKRSDHIGADQQRNEVKWRRVSGPIAATIATLTEIGFQTPSARHWITPDGKEWTYNDSPSDSRLFQFELAQIIRHQEWATAAQHWWSSGIDGDIDLTVARRMLKKLRLEGEDVKAAVLVRIVTGGMWPGERAIKAGYESQNVCPFCNDCHDSLAHRCWQCPAVDGIADDDIANSNAMKRFAISALDRNENECQWLRGLTPISCYNLEQAAWEEKQERHGVCIGMTEANPLDAIDCTVYLDESGGAFSSEVLLRRAGYGLAFFTGRRPHENERDACNMIGGIASSIAGPIQTTNRACLAAVCCALRLTIGAIEIVPDATYLINGIRERRHLQPQVVSVNGDL